MSLTTPYTSAIPTPSGKGVRNRLLATSISHSTYGSDAQGSVSQGSGQPIRVCLPDLYESNDGTSGSEEPVLVAEMVGHRHRHQLHRLARFLPKNRSRWVSMFTIGALLVGAGVLLVATLRGDGASGRAQVENPPPQWTRAVPRVEWSSQVSEQSTLVAHHQPPDAQVPDAQVVDQQPLFSLWPRASNKSRHVGPNEPVAAANSSAQLADTTTPPAPNPNNADHPSDSPPSYPQPARVAELTGTIETTIDKQRRR